MSVVKQVITMYINNTKIHFMDSGFSKSFSSAGQIPNPTGLLGGSDIFWQKNKLMFTFSTGPKLISSNRFGRQPLFIENPVD